MTTKTIIDGIQNADTLPALHSALVAYGELTELEQCEVDAAIDFSDLPTFGGPHPEDTLGVWSWDRASLLVGTCAADFTIVPREEN